MPSSPQLNQGDMHINMDNNLFFGFVSKDELIKATKLQPQPQPSSRYKTELCRPFEEFSTCKYGDKCQFAHGMGELRSLTRHPKYKTELCRTFHTLGLCPYGHRCHFVHSEYFKINPEEAMWMQLSPESESVNTPTDNSAQTPSNNNVNKQGSETSFSSSSSSSSISSGGSSPTRQNIQNQRLPVFWNF